MISFKAGESLFLRKLVLGIRAQASGKNSDSPRRIAFYFVSTFAIAQTPIKQPDLRLSRTPRVQQRFQAVHQYSHDF